MNNTEYYDKLPYYTPPLPRKGGLSRVLSITLGEVWVLFSWGGGGG